MLFEASSSDLSPALPSAASWVVDAMVGTIATVIAGIAVAGLGLLMLTGRIPARRAIGVITGCFVLFSAREIGGALVTGLDNRDAPPPTIAAQPTYRPAIPAPVPYDPYAGASVPVQPSQAPIR